MRHMIEDSFVIRDFMEIFLVQNFVFDGLLYPLIYDRFVDDTLTVQGGSAVAMLTSFMPTWFSQSSKWVDGVLKVAVAESEQNKALISQWTTTWRDRAVTALKPVAALAFGNNQETMLNEVIEQFNARAKKLGIAA